MYSSRLPLDGSQLRSDSALSGSISPHVRAPALALVSKWKGPDIQTLLRAAYASSSQSAAAGSIQSKATMKTGQRQIFAPAFMARSSSRPPQHRHHRRRRGRLDRAERLEAVADVERDVAWIGGFEIGRHAL